MANLRLATFNVENLFSRAKVFVEAPELGQAEGLLTQVEILKDLLKEPDYSKPAPDGTPIKQAILRLYLGEPGHEGEATPQGAQPALNAYIEIREDRGKLWKKGAGGHKIVGVAAKGQADWDGAIVFKRAEFSDKQRGNTAKVLKATKADILCIIEAEDKATMEDFDAHLMSSRYRYELLIDAFDPRGIDVGLFSKFPFGRLRTNMFEKVGNSRVFSRDCLEVEVLPDGQKPIYFLLNHFKSKGYDDGTAGDRRKRQADRVAKILEGYDLVNDRVVVCGDLNDTSDSLALSGLLAVPNLHDVLELQFGADRSKRWTYHYQKFEQIDYLLVSEPLKAAFVKAGVIRGGIFELNKMTSKPNSGVATETEFDTVTAFSNQASDHGAIWAEFTI